MLDSRQIRGGLDAEAPFESCAGQSAGGAAGCGSVAARGAGAGSSARGVPGGGVAASGAAAGAAAEAARPVTVRDILRAYEAQYVAAHPDTMPLVQRRALAEMAACGTAALGSHTWLCDSCGQVQVAYNACRNRHCARCGAKRRAAWLERVRQRLLPIQHFHLVFTLPHGELARLLSRCRTIE